MESLLHGSHGLDPENALGVEQEAHLWDPEQLLEGVGWVDWYLPVTSGPVDFGQESVLEANIRNVGKKVPNRRKSKPVGRAQTQLL